MNILQEFKKTNIYNNIISDDNTIMIFLGGSRLGLPGSVILDNSDFDIVVIQNKEDSFEHEFARYKYNDIYVDILYRSIQNLFCINEVNNNVFLLDGIFKEAFISNKNIIYENIKYKKICKLLKTSKKIKKDFKKIGLISMFDVLSNVRYNKNISIYQNIIDEFNNNNFKCLSVYNSKQYKYFASLYQYYCIFFNIPININVIHDLKNNNITNNEIIKIIVNILIDLKKYYNKHNFDYVSKSSKWNDKLWKLANR